ncbi:MAG: hypothetical protein GY859_12465, partial [Desulfobacterales bacterium]|nr:hypothetical protein [Desulfobacterales bacterium]
TRRGETESRRQKASEAAKSIITDNGKTPNPFQWEAELADHILSIDARPDKKGWTVRVKYKGRLPVDSAPSHKLSPKKAWRICDLEIGEKEKRLTLDGLDLIPADYDLEVLTPWTVILQNFDKRAEADETALYNELMRRFLRDENDKTGFVIILEKGVEGQRVEGQRFVKEKSKKQAGSPADRAKRPSTSREDGPKSPAPGRKDMDAPPRRPLPPNKITKKIRGLQRRVDDMVEERHPDMKGALQWEEMQKVDGVERLIRVFQKELNSLLDGREVRYTKRVVFFVDAEGDVFEIVIPIIELVQPEKKPPRVATDPWDARAFTPPSPKTKTHACMVLTNLKKIRQKHGDDHEKILRFLESFGPIIDISSERVDPSDFRSIDAMLEKRFDREKYNRLFIFGGHDVVPFGQYRNPARDIIDGDKDRLIYSDDPYADFDHDPADDWEVILCRLPDDKGILKSAKSVIHRPPPPGDGLEHNDFVVYGNRNWPVTDKIALLGAPSRPGLIKCGPYTSASFPPSFFMGRNIFIGLHGADWDGTNYYGETKWQEKTPGAPPPPEALRKAINIYQANAPGSVIMSGACYGADIIDNPTSDTLMALRFLRNGARAYIGNTGVGFIGSDLTNTFGLWTRLFKENLDKGASPQEAFARAKRAYARVGRIQNPYQYKMHHQMIYLGLPPAAPVAGFLTDDLP